MDGYFLLKNGVYIPNVGFGVFRIPEGEETANAVKNAIDAGYRHIDTARGYWNESGVGEGIRRSGLPRQKIFVTTKLWMHDYSEEAAYDETLRSLEYIGGDYIDLVLLHQSVSDYYGAWRGLEKLYKQGIVRALGVSNFTAERLTDLCIYSDVKPVVNQVKIDPFEQRGYLEAVHEKLGVRMESWSPLGGEGNNRVFNESVLVKIGEKYGKAPAQVVLRWLFQRGVVSVAKTTRPERMRENLDIFDFELTAGDMSAIAALDEYGTDTYDLRRAENAQMLRNVVEKHRDKYQDR